MLFSRDTSPEAERVLVGLLRGKTPAQRLAMVFRLNELARTMARSGLRARNPGASEEEIEARYAELVLGREMAARVLAARKARGIGAAARSVDDAESTA